MPPTLTEIDKWLVVSPFTLLWQGGEARNDGKFSGGTFRKYLRAVVLEFSCLFCLSAANRKESFSTTQCKHRERKRGGRWVARSSHSCGAALPDCSTLLMRVLCQRLGKFTAMERKSRKRASWRYGRLRDKPPGTGGVFGQRTALEKRMMLECAPLQKRCANPSGGPRLRRRSCPARR